MWLYFLLFTVLVVGCIWIFQIFFVEGYYQNKKLKEVYNYGRSISQLTVNTSAFNEKPIAEIRESTSTSLTPNLRHA